jgi:hypothetical protein
VLAVVDPVRLSIVGCPEGSLPIRRPARLCHYD